MQPGTMIADRFRVETIAGRGGMGVVYRALDVQTNEQVAVKILSHRGHAQTERFAREIWMLSDLRHPHIVRYISSGEIPEEGLYLVMEWLEGEDLSQRLRRGPLSIEDTIVLIREVAVALGFAHAKGVVHRDIKPPNLYLPNGRLEQVKILDFGIARPQDPMHEMTKTGVIMGSLGYLAPEQATRGAKGLDSRADIFALGCVLFECVTGRSAFVGENLLAVLSKVLLADPPQLSAHCQNVPEGLDDLLSRMLSKNPNQRPANGDALATELSSIVPSTIAKPAARPTTLTEGERRFIGVVMLSRASTQALHEMDTVPSTGNSFDAPLRVEAERFTARLDFLLDGSALVTFSGSGGIMDQAFQAARCALAISAKMPTAVLSLALGRADVSQQLPVGEVIDRAVGLLYTGSAQGVEPGVWVDETTSGFLGDRFGLEHSPHGTKLLTEVEELDTERTLLGKKIPCVGRERELSMLEAVARECQDESASRVVLILGPAGIGKTKLRQEFMRRAGSSFEAFVSRGEAMRQGSTLGMLAPALRRAAKIFEGEPLEDSRKKLLARVSQHLSGQSLQRTAGFLGEILGLSFPDDGIPSLKTARQDPQFMGEQQQRAFLDFLGAELSVGPVLFLIEDVHWGDLPTIKFLDNALREFAEQPLLVLAFARSEVRSLFPDLFAERALTEIRLGELSKKAAERLVKSALGEQIEPSIVARIVERGSTNALYLEELCRATAAGREDLPETVIAMVSARLEGLPAEARKLGRAASIFGEIFPVGALAPLLGSADNLRATLQQLNEKEILSRRGESRFAGEEEWSFRHNLFKEGFYAMLTPEDKALGHRLVGEWLEQRGENNALLLATHFEKGNEKTKAIKWLVEAAGRANQASDHRVVFALAARAVELSVAGYDLGLLRAYEITACSEIGDALYGIKVGLEALSCLPADDIHWFQTAGWLVVFCGVMQDFATMQQVIGQLMVAPITPESLPAQIQALGGVCWVSMLAGQGQQARVFNARFDVLVAQLPQPDPATRCWIHHVKGVESAFVYDLPWRFYQEASGLMETARLVEKQGVHYYAGPLYTGLALSALGRADEGAAIQAPLVGEIETKRRTVMLAAAKRVYGNTLVGLGRADEAISLLEGSIAISEMQKNPFDEAEALHYLAVAYLQKKELEKAETAARKAYQMPSALYSMAGGATLARALVAQDKPQEALEIVNATEEKARQFLLEECIFLRELLLAKAEALLALGAPEAKEAITAAKAHLHKVASNIPDEAGRERFLHNIPEHAQILAL
jgi:serine/threonine protein kinase/tetratricopeptide (TPR) repeat protein